MELGELPVAWETAELAEICLVNPTIDKSAIADDLAVSFVPMPAVEAESGGIDVSETRKFGEVKKGYTPFREGDVLFAKITPCMENGKMAVVPALHNGLGFGSTEFHVLRAHPGISPQFVYYFVSSRSFRHAAEHNMSGAVGQRRVTTPYLSACKIPVPPTAEQHRIVAKIEELFSELDQGVASLKTAREQLKVYRQSLLKNAFEGKLTAAWRAAHADQLETATALQQRIARERQARYQQQLADWQTAGQAGPKPKPPKPLPPLTAEELAELPELPAGWGWVKLGELTYSVKDGPHFSPKYSESGVPFISGGNVRPEGIDFTKTKYISPKLHEELSKRCKPDRGDLLYTKGGTTGIARVNTYDIDFNVWVHVAVLKLTGAALPFYVQHALNSSFCYSQAQKYTHGVGNQDLGLTRMVNIVLAVCSLSEQEEVIQIVDDKMSVIDQLDQTLATALQQADALRQSILKKAFSGHLVKQDKNEEPATALLERIRASQSGQGQGKRRRIAPEQPAILELKASPGQVIPFPVPLPGIAAKDLQAGIVAMAYRLHEAHPEKLEHFGHVKAEKICHLVEAHLGLDLERQPVKEAAGPNDHPHLKRVEHRARLANWFEVTRLDSGKYVFHPKPGFSRLLDKTRQVLGARLGEVERLLELMLPMTMRQAEILATVYAAWNNLLLLGKSPNDEEIVTEARENWHESKRKIDREKFFRALEWMREKGLVPAGRGRFVVAKGEK